jgi:hypothetical protein
LKKVSLKTLILEKSEFTCPPAEVSKNLSTTQEYFLQRWNNYDQFYVNKERTDKSLKERKKISTFILKEPTRMFEDKPIPVESVESKPLIVESHNNMSDRIKKSDQKSKKRRKGF